MSVYIRLRRIGKRPSKRPHFRITVFDQRRSRDSAFIEELGFYNPITKAVKMNQERLAYWIKNGAQPTEAIKKLMRGIKKEV